MNLYIDIDRNQLVCGPTNSGAVSTLYFKRGDAVAIQATFQQMTSGGYSPVVLASGTTFQFALKVPGQYDGGFVVYCNTWTAPTGSATAYAFQPSFNTTELNALLEPGGDVASDLPQVMLMGEIAWTDSSGNETSTRTFNVIVYNDVIKDDEGTPTAATPGYPTASSILTNSLAGTIAMVSGQSAYTLDMTALGLTAAPRGALFNLITPTTAENTYGARMVASTTTATTLIIQTDAVPDNSSCLLAYLILP